MPPPPPGQEPPLWRRGWFLVVMAVLGVGVVGAVVASSGDDEPDTPLSLGDLLSDDGDTSFSFDFDDGSDEDASADVVRCTILEDERVEFEVVNSGSETSTYWITTVYRDDAGNRLADEVNVVSNLRPGERTIEEVFAFDTQGTTCEAADVDRYSAASAGDELDDGVSCTLTGRDFADDLTADVVVSNNSSLTSDYYIEVAFVTADRLRVGTGTAYVNAVAAGETAPTEVFSTVDRDAAACEIIAISRTAS